MSLIAKISICHIIFIELVAVVHFDIMWRFLLRVTPDTRDNKQEVINTKLLFDSNIYVSF